jgi:hypothetical protein
MQVSRHFRAHCDYARKGKDRGYEQVGKLFVWEVVERKGSTQDLIDFLELLQRQDNTAVLNWVKKRYASHLALIPVKGYAEFLLGVYACGERLELYVIPARLEHEAQVSQVYCQEILPRSVLRQLNPKMN